VNVYVRAAVGAALLFVSGSAMETVSQAAYASGPMLLLSPSRVRIGGRTTLHGRHLRPKSFYTVLFQAPHDPHGRFSRLLGLARTNAHGSVTMTIQIPIVPHCGTASVLAYLSRHTTTSRAPLTVTGCKAGNASAPPPPPPSQPAKGHHKKP
jgi:hypothetical protein